MRFGRTGIATLVATMATTAFSVDDVAAEGLPRLPARRPTVRGISAPTSHGEPAPLAGPRSSSAGSDCGGGGTCAQAVSSLDEAATATFGPLDPARAAVLGRGAWFEDADVDVFVVGPVEDASFVAVPAGTIVTEDGDVVVPPPDESAYTAPLFADPGARRRRASSPR